jgi:hypothetical protein
VGRYVRRNNSGGIVHSVFVILTGAPDLFQIEAMFEGIIMRVLFCDADPVGAKDDIEFIGTEVHRRHQMNN